MHSWPEQFDAIAAVAIRRALLERMAVRLPGWGRLRVVHYRSRREPGPDGKVYIFPPEDRVVFEAEESEA
jgi:hypothetical protein|nr:MAG: hypothetical protein KatS3mg041_1384 [Bacteroidota bacterium]